MSAPTQLATPSAAEPCTPWIPPELISIILSKLWEGTHAPQDRSALLVKIALVNRTWLTLIAHITALDAHLSSCKEMIALLGALPQSWIKKDCRDLLTMERKRVANQSCRSLTCHLDGTMLEHPRPTNNHPVDLSIVFRDLYLFSHLPNLRHISISHTNCAPNGIFQHFYQGFPAHVTHLSLDYSFTPTAKIPPFDPDNASWWLSMHEHYPRKGPPVCLPNLRRISRSGAPTACAAIVLRMCPNVDTLELTRPEGPLHALAPLPQTVRTLVLRHPGGPPRVVSSEGEAGYPCAFPETLDAAGLFPTGRSLRPPRIIVRAPDTAPDPRAPFVALRRSCERLKVELVYEREDALS